MTISENPSKRRIRLNLKICISTTVQGLLKAVKSVAPSIAVFEKTASKKSNVNSASIHFFDELLQMDPNEEV